MTTFTPVQTRPVGRSRRLVYPTALAVLGVTGVASAFWSTGAFGTGTATTATLNPPTNVTATVDNQRVGVTWTAPAAGGAAQAPSSYRVTRDGTPVDCGTGSSPTTCVEHDVPVGGPYTYTVTSVLGSWTAAATSNAVTVSAPVSAPALTLDAPAAPISTTPTFTGTTDSTEPISIEVFAGSAASGPVVATATVASPTSNWTSTVTSPALAAGHQYTARATQTNRGGTTSKTVTFTVPQPHTLTITSPTAGSYVKSPTPTISGTATSSGTVSVKLCPVATSNCSATAVTATPAGTSNAWSVTWSPALTADGSYLATATQANGATTSTTFVRDTTAPTPTISLAARSGNSGSGSASGNVGTQPGDGSTITAAIYAGNATNGTNLIGSHTVQYGAGGTWSIVWDNARSVNNKDTYTFVVTQTDAAGNVATVTRPLG